MELERHYPIVQSVGTSGSKPAPELVGFLPSVVLSSVWVWG